MPDPSRRSPAAYWMLFLALLTVSTAAEAYVGPGAGFAIMGSFLSIFLALMSGLLSLALWPFRFAIRWLRQRKVMAKAKVKRVVIVGLDGLDPTLAERWMAAGELPNLSAIKAQGSFGRLRTTYPSISPVAWSSFMTGVDPSRHNIFDFLDRDLRTYKPRLSSSQVASSTRTMRVGNWIIPLGKPLLRSMRKSRAFWNVLGDFGVPCNILRVPLTFPPEKFAGAMLSAMCVPDLRGTQGSFTYFTTNPDEVHTGEDSSEDTGGLRILVKFEGDTLQASLPGPGHPLKADHPELALPFSVKRNARGDGVVLTIDRRRYKLSAGKYSPWIRLVWRAAPGLKVHGIARFYVTKLDDHFGLYVTPINIDPGSPELPISWPFYYSVYLSKMMGEFATLGLAEDTWALNEGVIDEQAFFQQVMDHHEEREKMLLNALEKSRKGVVACVFDGTDRAQHMFFRHLEHDHPANRGKDTERFKDAVLDVYRRADQTIGKVLEHIGPDDHLMVISDHGFQSFRRGVNLNAWLRDHGLLFLKDGAETCGDWFEGVDWTRTKAYAFGLSGIYINQKGREADGIVRPGQETDALKAEIIKGLSGLVDEECGVTAIKQVFDCAVVHTRGPYQADNLDLVVGYDRGYRASWESATGRVTEEVFSDNTKCWSGDHCVDPRLVPGVLYSNRRIVADDPGIEDLAPTVLDLFGVEAPAHMTGKRLTVEATTAARAAAA
ncbi:MAG: alkaline phosphatase family protein [Chitinophagaceae bacterium]